MAKSEKANQIAYSNNICKFIYIVAYTDKFSFKICLIESDCVKLYHLV